MAESSALAFSSSRRRTALSQSKMPPQQGNGLLDVGDLAFGFRAHGCHIGCGAFCVKSLLATRMAREILGPEKERRAERANST
jgi:hypothetical protein